MKGGESLWMLDQVKSRIMQDLVKFADRDALKQRFETQLEISHD